MAFVTCPSCGEKGRIPLHLIGKRIKCSKCAASFQVAPPGAKAHAAGAVAPAMAVAATSASQPGTIEVEGLDAASWSATAVLGAEGDHHHHDHDHHHDEATAAFTASPHDPTHPEVHGKQYKVLTPKDKWFGGKFELARLEEALNHYAREGWVVRSMATPLVTGFSGGPREELVVLLER